jgi:murein DD-endopeptidase MepM/ murein hydrolase activator NlpD
LHTYIFSSLTQKASFVIKEAMPAILILGVLFSYDAGMFVKVSEVFAKETTEATPFEAVDNSPLNTPLLSAAKSRDLQSAIGGGDVVYEDGALVSQGPVTEEELTKQKQSSDEISVYVVREGDSLSQIAEMYGVNTNTILWANDLKSAKEIKAGDTLVILPIAGVRHKVVKGETLGAIVKKYDANLEEVIAYNNLASESDITEGEEIIIPGGEIQEVAKPAPKKAAPTKTTAKKVSGSGLTHPAPGAIRTQGIHGYNGVDLAGAYGSTIRAAGGGKVIVSKAGGWNGGYGTYIVIKHDNGTQTLYAHLSANNVSVGDWVEKGQTIGGMGNSGKSTGTHLHFEVRGGTNPF